MDSLIDRLVAHRCVVQPERRAFLLHVRHKGAARYKRDFFCDTQLGYIICINILVDGSPDEQAALRMGP